jgi:hypothetical protein
MTKIANVKKIVDDDRVTRSSLVVVVEGIVSLTGVFFRCLKSGDEVSSIDDDDDSGVLFCKVINLVGTICGGNSIGD